MATLEALGALKRIHLPQDHIEEGAPEERTDDRHFELAPYMLEALKAINSLNEQLCSVYPAPADTDASEKSADDFDLEFDLVDGPTGEGSRLSAADAAASEKSQREQVNETVYALGGMLRSRVASFAPRLHHALSVGESWALLSELDHYQHALTKSLQGLLFGVLAIFNGDVRREEILPEYRSGVRESVELRGALTELTHHVGKLNSAIASAKSEQLVPLVVALSDRLTRFCARPAYRVLRAEDKREIVDFRSKLFSIRHQKNGVPMVRLRQEVEGFSKFLDAMQAINHREVLVVHDCQRLVDCLQRLQASEDLAVVDPESARNRFDSVIEQLGSVYGRNPELDEALRKIAPVALETLVPELQRWAAIVERTQGMVG